VAEPRLSIVIPVYNEEGILHASVVDLMERLAELPRSLGEYEILLAENGSSDGTVTIANELAQRYPQVKVDSLGRPARDKRPLPRRVATLPINGMLRVLLGFRGTDTHGLKAFRREALLPTVRNCQVDRDLFASEFVIRAQREGKRVTEIPVHIAEKRPPSINLFKRIKLTYVIRVNG
jgi:glycosyltransferase involved in cell wall biosynthesis